MAHVLEDLEVFLESDDPMRNILEEVDERIDKNTAAGKDYRGHKFPPYAESSKKRGKTVDLHDSGTMLGAKKRRVMSPTHGKIWIQPRRYPRGQSADMIADFHDSGRARGGKVRKFMDIPKSALQKIVKKHYDDKIMRILGRI